MKTEILESIKIISYYLYTVFLISTVIYTTSAEIKLKDQIGSVKPHLKIIAICYNANELNEEKTKQKFWPLEKILW